MSDANANDILQSHPWAVVADDGIATGIVGRFAAQGDADADATARTQALRDTGNEHTNFTVVNEAEPAPAAPTPTPTPTP